MPDNTPASHISEMLLKELNSSVPDWMEESNCLDAEDLNDADEMAPLCASCPVVKQCREYAEDRGVSSLVWGYKDFQTGLSLNPDERESTVYSEDDCEECGCLAGYPHSSDCSKSEEFENASNL